MPLQVKQAKEIVGRLLTEEVDPKEIVNAVLPSKPGALFAAMEGPRKVCTRCGFEALEWKGNCIECGGVMADIEASARPIGASEEDIGQGAEMINKSIPIYLIPVPLTKEPPEERKYTLASLRPNDRFTFLKEIPDIDLELDREYQVVPARRGGVSFSDQAKRTFTVSLIAAHLFPVRLTSEDTVDPGQRFYPGDKVCHKGDKWKGVVIGYEGMGYNVRPVPDDPEQDDDGQGREWVPSNWLRLMDKQKTTRNYIREEDGRFVVFYGGLVDSVEVCHNFLSAIQLLFRRNRVAFNRFSRWLSDPSPDNDMLHFVNGEVRVYLEKVDKACWKQGR